MSHAKAIITCCQTGWSAPVCYVFSEALGTVILQVYKCCPISGTASESNFLTNNSRYQNLGLFITLLQ